MPVALGSTDISKAYLGSTQLSQMYLGTEALLGPTVLWEDDFNNGLVGDRLNLRVPQKGNGNYSAFPNEYILGNAWGTAVGQPAQNTRREPVVLDFTPKPFTGLVLPDNFTLQMTLSCAGASNLGGTHYPIVTYNMTQAGQNGTAVNIQFNDNGYKVNGPWGTISVSGAGAVNNCNITMNVRTGGGSNASNAVIEVEGVNTYNRSWTQAANANKGLGYHTHSTGGTNYIGTIDALWYIKVTEL